jgi:hypothetical protein
MTETARNRTVPRQGSAPPAATGWVGWIIFAAVLTIMMGVFHAIAGLVALFKDGYYLVASEDLVVSFDYTAWGWTHLLLGVLFVAGGAALLSGRTWARAMVTVVAVISCFANFAFISAYPVWSVTMLAVSVLVIWAVVVHGDEMKSVR